MASSEPKWFIPTQKNVGSSDPTQNGSSQPKKMLVGVMLAHPNPKRLFVPISYVCRCFFPTRQRYLPEKGISKGVCAFNDKGVCAFCLSKAKAKQKVCATIQCHYAMPLCNATSQIGW